MIINKQLKQLRCFEAASSVSDRVSVAQNWIPLPFHSLEMNFFGQCQANLSLRFHKRKISNQLPFQSGEEKKLFPTFEKFQDSWIYKFDFFVFFLFFGYGFRTRFSVKFDAFLYGWIWWTDLSWISFLDLFFLWLFGFVVAVVVEMHLKRWIGR